MSKLDPRCLAASMSLILAVASLGAPLPAQADGNDIPAPVLRPRDLSSLQKQLKTWWSQELKINALRNLDSTSKGAQKRIRSLKKKAKKAKRKFRDEFAKKGAKIGGLERHLGDLLAIWDECFEYKSVPNGGRSTHQYVDKKKKTGFFTWRFPKGYKPNKRWPLVFCLPNRVTVRGKEKWAAGKDYIDTAWPAGDKGGLGDSYIFACPRLPEDMDLSATVDPTKGADATEDERIDMFFLLLGHLVNTFKIDSDRIFLEACGKSTPFAMRLASTFPDRFAGLILRNPQGTNEAIPENLRNMAVAILYDGTGADRAEAFANRLKDQGHGNVLIKEGKGALPFAGSANSLDNWMGQVKRNLFTHEFVLIPTNDRFKKAYWIEILAADAIADTGREFRPRLEVKADRTNNRIEVKARNISEVMFHLNDAIVDLDKPITFVLNGKLLEEKRQRTVRLISNPAKSLIILRNDPRAVFVARGRYKIPEVEAQDKSGGGETGNGK